MADLFYEDSLNVTMTHSVTIDWESLLSKFKRNHIENEVVMAATESQSIFQCSMAI